MQDDEEEDETSNLGVQRYPCMPSLVALQQMRNRLHLARLGRKLMKWTALATGRELRRLAKELAIIYDSFSVDMANAFMLIARGRYFYPNLNKMVLQYIGVKPARITVTTSLRPISAGVKVLHFEIIDNGIDPYEHLALEKGGQAIKEAKDAWFALLKRIIIMLQFRISFYLEEIAHKAATKKQNVLGKIVIPKTQNSVNYIILELEELAREEFSRLKKVQEKKKGKNKTNKPNHNETGHSCPVCAAEKAREANRVAVAKSVSITSKPKSSLKIKEPSNTENDIFKETVSIVSEREIFMSKQHDEFDKVSEASVGLHLPARDTIQTRLGLFKDQLTKILIHGKELLEKGYNEIDVKTFLNNCADAMQKLDQNLETTMPDSVMDPAFKNRIEHLKSELQDVKKEFDDQTSTPTNQNFLKTCEAIEKNIDNLLKKAGSKHVVIETSDGLKDLKSQIEEVVKLIEDYKNEGLLATDANAFIKSCDKIKSELEIPTEDIDNTKSKIEHLKEHIIDLKRRAADMCSSDPEGLNEFLLSCKMFERQLDAYKYKKPPDNETFAKLANEIGETIKLSKEAEKKALVSNSVEDFIELCKKVKQQIEMPKKVEKKQRNVLQELKSNIEKVIDLSSNLRKDGLMTASVEKFIKFCELTQAKYELYERYPQDELGEITINPICGKSCICGLDEANEPCDRCEEIITNQDSFILDSNLPPPECNFCKQRPEKPAKPLSLCSSCVELPQYGEKNPSNGSEISDTEMSEEHLRNCLACRIRKQEEEAALAEASKELKMCKLCESHKAAEEEDVQSLPSEEAQEEIPPEVDSSLGYFEKRVRKTTIVTRTRNEDGTIREEKETITVKKVRRDPTELTIEDDDESDGNSYKSEQNDNDSKKVALCTINEQAGFRRPFKKCASDVVKKTHYLGNTDLRRCLSLETHRVITLLDPDTASDNSVEIKSFSLTNVTPLQNIKLYTQQMKCYDVLKRV